MHILTIDGGTSATRVSLWSKGLRVAQARRELGVRDISMGTDRSASIAAVREGMEEVLASAQISLPQIEAILACGMITSNLGLVEVPHLTAPVGMDELARGMLIRTLPEVCDTPIHFIPGVQNYYANSADNTFDDLDRMRGEECEVMGLIELLRLNAPTLFLLPGSHSKFVHVDGARRITACLTTMAGELLEQLTRHTILADAVEGHFATSLDFVSLKLGMQQALLQGLSRTAFVVRLQQLSKKMDVNQRANYLLGSVMAGDIQALQHNSVLGFDKNTEALVVAGKPLWRDALASLLEDIYPGRVHTYTGDIELAGRGALAVHQHHLMTQQSSHV